MARIPLPVFLSVPVKCKARITRTGARSGGSKGSVNLGDIWPMGVRRSRYDQ